jgi:hypothetical protein
MATEKALDAGRIAVLTRLREREKDFLQASAGFPDLPEDRNLKGDKSDTYIYVALRCAGFQKAHTARFHVKG